VTIPQVESSASARPTGLRRLARAIEYSLAGLRHAAVHETAVRQELIALVILVPISAMLPVSTIEHLLLVLPLMLLVVVELLNSAVERTVDRISDERHPLAGQAKDMASAAVFVAVLMAGLSWTVIAGPVVLSWIRGVPVVTS
jgi:diacylglycerol kinase (ATP)